MIIHLVSSPRTVSTSLMYSFDNREDTKGIDEPFYAYYLRKTNKSHPGKKEVLRELPAEEKNIFKKINSEAENFPHIFIKNMAQHLVGIDTQRLVDFTNIFLIRDPKYIIHSLSKVWSPLDMLDIGVEEQWHRYDDLRSSGGTAIVLDSSDILKNPELTLKKLCAQIDLEYSDSMISWDPGPRSIDGCWAQYYYKQTHLSSGFLPYREKNVSLDDYHRELYEVANNYYKQLQNHAI